jgi:alkanesulfonate monooxygenase SsuD/methylene tetrahydromethanopterin reductase-like flavin-dependent oxidoreductase (luciferase family)
MIKFGSSLLRVARPDDASAVEKAGFDSIWVVDHFAPFSHQSGLIDPATGGGWGALPILLLLLATKSSSILQSEI